MGGGLKRFAGSKDGTVTIEFVVVFLGFIAIIFFVIEVTLFMFFRASLEKAAQAGARAAVVSPAVVAGLPATIARADTTKIFGRKCSDATNPCATFATLTCTGGGCQAVPFTRILNHMRGFNGAIEAENVTFTYQDVGLGFAGGPTVPMVTVTIEGVPFQTGIIGLLLTNAGILSTLPPQSASMTGEDLAL